MKRMIRQIAFCLLFMTPSIFISCTPSSDEHKPTTPSHNLPSKKGSDTTDQSANNQDNNVENPNSANKELATTVTSSPTPTPYLERGDLEQLKEYEKLRFLVPDWEGSDHLPRAGSTTEKYRRLAIDFAKTVSLTPEWIAVPNIESLITYLLEGKGDVIATNLTVTPGRKEQIQFALPLDQVQEKVIVAQQSTTTLTTLKTILIPKGSSFVVLAQDLQKSHPQIAIEYLEDEGNQEQLIDYLQDKPTVATILDDNTVEVLAQYRDDFKTLHTFSNTKNIAWATRPTTPLLTKALNQFLTESSLSQHLREEKILDWKQIKERKTLRILTRNNPTSYFLWRGELMGFEYELLKRFADQHHLYLEIIVPPYEVDLLDWLEQGRGDIVAASLTITPEREARPIQFTRPYNSVQEQIVAPSGTPAWQSLKDIAGKTLVVNEHTSYAQTLKSLLETGDTSTVVTTHESTNELSTTEDSSTPLKFELDMASHPNESTSRLIQMVADKSIPYTLADSNIVNIEKSWGEEVEAVYTFEKKSQIAWAVNKESSGLLNQLNAYLNKEYKDLIFNVIYNKYFKSAKSLKKLSKHILKGEQLSPYDHLIKKYTQATEFDWRLITAQMYQESRFDPKAKSFAGARGLLQVLPRTAKQFGYKRLYDPDVGIAAGVTYLDWVQDRFSQTLPLEERIRFSLAAYNAGFGHVHDAQRLAKKLGKNDKKWFGNVEEAMLLLSKPEYAKKARYGYVRGREPVHYVRQIQSRYLGYLSTGIE